VTETTLEKQADRWPYVFVNTGTILSRVFYRNPSWLSMRMKRAIE
jgi:hypothetical protein